MYSVFRNDFQIRLRPCESFHSCIWFFWVGTLTESGGARQSKDHMIWSISYPCRPYRGMNQSERGRLKEGGANRTVSMATGCLRCHSGARGRSLAGPSAMLRLEGANQERDAKKKGPIRGGDGDSERTSGERSWGQVNLSHYFFWQENVLYSLSLMSFCKKPEVISGAVGI